jgi:hypothetical protein
MSADPSSTPGPLVQEPSTGVPVANSPQIVTYWFVYLRKKEGSLS